jgi:SAM-dependent methyltransferase
MRNHRRRPSPSTASNRRLVACPACGSSGSVAFRTKDWNRVVSDESFVYVRCQTCRLLYLESIPDDLSTYYVGDYHSIPRHRDDLDAQADQERFKIDIVREHVREGRLLEVGPSFGAFATLAQESGFHVDAVEPDSACRTFLFRELGIQAFESVDGLKAAAPASYDVIALWQVFEHMPDAWEFLELASGLLRPGGVIVIATPNPESMQARIWGSRWTHVDAPRHVILVPPQTLADHAKRSGLRPVRLTFTDAGSRGWNTFGWATSMANQGSGRRSRRLLGWLGRAFALFLRPIERTGSRGSCYTLVLEKSVASA